MFVHLSPYCALAVGGGQLSQKLTLAAWPKPIGLGETVQKEYVGICHAGECALTIVIEVAIEIAKRITNTIDFVLFSIFSYFLSIFLDKNKHL